VKKMIQRIAKTMITFLLITGVFAFVTDRAEAASTVYVQVGDKNAVGTSVNVPVYIRFVSDRPRELLALSNGKFTIESPSNASFLKVKGFKPSASFNGSKFQTFSRINGNEITVEFTSAENGANQQVKSALIGHIQYERSKSARRGESATIGMRDIFLSDRNGNAIAATPTSGKVEHNLMVGDIVGKDEVTPAAAIRLLQHVNNKRPIRNYEEFNSADVNGDGAADLADATMIMRYVTGLENSFLSMSSYELPFAALNVPYTARLEAVHGKAPYTWDVARGRLPRGLELNNETGEVTGIVTRESETDVTLVVSDVTGKKVERKFTVSAIKTDIQSVAKIPELTVIKGQAVTLPEKVFVTFTNGSTSELAVKWGTVDTAKIGTKYVEGQLEGQKIKVTAQVNVVEEGTEIPEIGSDEREDISNIQVKRFTLLSTTMHTIEFDSSNNVFSATLSFGSGRSKTVLPMIYDPDENFEQPRFSRGTTLLQSTSEVTISLYNQVGTKISEQTFKLGEFLVN
jgi:hypothetical protein